MKLELLYICKFIGGVILFIKKQMYSHLLTQISELQKENRELQEHNRASRLLIAKYQTLIESNKMILAVKDKQLQEKNGYISILNETAKAYRDMFLRDYEDEVLS